MGTARRTPAFRRLPRSVREQQMLDAAVKIFSRRGFHLASMDEIAELAGVSKPMVYAYLGAKEELFVACLHREATRLAEAVVGSVQPDAPPDRQLWNGLRAFFGFVAAHRDGWRVLYRQARGQEPFASEVVTMRARMVEIVLGQLGRAVGGAGSPRELTTFAYALVGACEALADWLAGDDAAPEVGEAAPDVGDAAADDDDEQLPAGTHHAGARDPEALATRLMNFVWLGADARLRGVTWHP